jgi:hypothetical protein
LVHRECLLAAALARARGAVSSKATAESVMKQYDDQWQAVGG